MKINDLKNRDDLAKFLKIELKNLTYILYKKKVENFYETFSIPKKNGEERIINAPKDNLKYILKILERKLNKIYNENYCKNRFDNIAQAFRKKKSFITNASLHRNKKYVINIDLKDFFDSFHFGRVKGFFEKDKLFLLPEEVSIVIAQLTCYNGKLPQGAPTSPVITNFICRILDKRIVKLSNKYRLSYTRYADDLTFSTNDFKIEENYETFLEELRKMIKNFGFEINEEKTSFRSNRCRQTVTGLVVNKKVNCKREYYKKTKAMAHALYKTGEFYIDGQKGTINQLEGRFSFINQIDKYNNKKNDKNILKGNFNIREYDYKKFLVYKIFLQNDSPLIITEGKSDVRYLKAALMNQYKNYSNLIYKQKDEFVFKIKFLKRTNRLLYFFKLSLDGADTNINIYNIYENKDGSLFDLFIKKYKTVPKNPVIIIFDNEDSNKKPLVKFLNNVKNKSVPDKLKNNLNACLKENSNLYILTNPKICGLQNTEIENLFTEETLKTKINGKTLSLKNDYNVDKYYGKEIFSKFILKNYSTIDFSNFVPMLDALNNIVLNYNKKN